ncbi:outer membrane lipoprotein carrier protein LolA [Caballeronia sp. LZ025]|uniref:LolA family protein n=1 Tax=Caballeronia TaxID=1827195 RepID=UPI001FD30719|nr:MULTISPECIES: outer membrane lipoprotein carrier protein LolA [Caballeronia]MDR5735792.1 outer membrane lipoprotein carrier protein LolA [Caballeronia sp. LZ025]
MKLRCASTALVALLLTANAGWLHAATPAQNAGGDAALVSQVTSRLGQVKGVHAQFTQTQTLAAMKQPLVSTGAFVFYRERGVIWRVLTPYKATFVITDAGVAEVDANGKRIGTKSVQGVQGVRGVAQVSKMMRAMLGGDLSALYSQFDVDAQGSPSQWALLLKPNQPQLAQSIKGLHMKGGAFLQSLRIELANGDVTQIDFTQSEALDDVPAAERGLLGAP